MRVSGPFKVLSECLLLRHTGHSRQRALRVMMVMPVMEVLNAHLSFRVALEAEEVNLPHARLQKTSHHRNPNLFIDAQRSLSYSFAVNYPKQKETH
jgi:hypothetical protein